MMKAEPITTRELEKQQSRKRCLGCTLRWCCLPAVAVYLIAFIWSWASLGCFPHPLSPVADLFSAGYYVGFKNGLLKYDPSPTACTDITLVEHDNRPAISYETEVPGNQLRFAFLDQDSEGGPTVWRTSNLYSFDDRHTPLVSPRLAYINDTPFVLYCAELWSVVETSGRTALPSQTTEWASGNWLYSVDIAGFPMYIDLKEFDGKLAMAAAYTRDDLLSSHALGNKRAAHQTYSRFLVYGRSRTHNMSCHEDWIFLELPTVTGPNLADFHSLELGTADGLPAIVSGSSQGVTFTAAQVAEPDFAAQFDRHTVIAGADANYVSYALLGDRPVIGFIDGFTNELQISIARVAMPTQAADWDTHTVTSGQVLRSLSLAIINDRLAAVVQIETMAAPTHQNDWRGNYTDNGDGAYNLVYAYALIDLPAAASDWQLVTVDGGDSTGFFCDLAEVNGYPAIAYCDVSEEALKLAWATAVQPVTAADWNIETVDDLAALEPADD